MEDRIVVERVRRLDPDTRAALARQLDVSRAWIAEQRARPLNAEQAQRVGAEERIVGALDRALDALLLEGGGS